MSISPFEFGKIVATHGRTKSAGGLGDLAQSAGNAIGKFFRTPAQAGQQAALTARNTLKPVNPGTGALSEPVKDYWKARDGRMLKNPDQARTYDQAFNDLRRMGENQDEAAAFADSVAPQYVPRRQALQSVANAAAKQQAATQIGVGAAGTAGLGAAAGYAAGSAGK